MLADRVGGQSIRLMFNDTFLGSDQAVFPHSVTCTMALGCVVKSPSSVYVSLGADDDHRWKEPSAEGTGFSGWIHEKRYPADNIIIGTASDQYPGAETNAVAVN
jgi:hypothetical protein